MTTTSQYLVISAIERACSVFSILGCLFIIGTFCLSSSFHKPVNRMVFYASFGNMFCNVATLMSRSFLDETDSVGCQTQAFLIQMFMPADTCWALAMAINVYLTFYRRFDVGRLRKLEPLYLALCYGVPLVPALAFIFAKRNGQRAYGNAILWCWLAEEWDVWRVAAFYGPIWVVTVFTFFIYIRAGHTIYKWRKKLKNFSSSNDMGPFSQLGEPSGGTKTTEVTVTTSDAPSDSNRTCGHEEGPAGAYSANISAESSVSYVATMASSAERGRMKHRPALGNSPRDQTDKAALSYTKCAILFFTAMLITWIPSSANRVHDLVHGQSNAALEFMSAFVLPLQGFWNAVIYFSTSRAACRELFTNFRLRRQTNLREIVGRVDASESASGPSHQLKLIRSPNRDRCQDTESTASLARTRSKSPAAEWRP